jgi:hypothetical protein
MTLAGLELNSTHVRAVSGPEDMLPLAVTLDGDEVTLPMALSLEHRRHPEVGRPGAALCRRYPHLACVDFLGDLGTSRSWGMGRHRLDAAKALGLVLGHLRPALVGTAVGILALPTYLSRAQVEQILELARKARLPIKGSAPSPLASALAAHAEKPLSGLVLVVDGDEHALTWSVLKFGQDKAQMVVGKALAQLSLLAWKGCLLDAIADLCIHQSRRDPRDSGSAEQLLYDQLDDVFEVTAQDQLVEVVIRAANWCQNLILQPAQVRAFCDRLLLEAVDELRGAVAETPQGFPQIVLVSASAGRLPGLVAALHNEMPEPVPVILLAPDAASRGAHALAVRIQRGELAHGHRDGPIALPAAEATPPTAASRRVISITSVKR